MFLNQWLSSLLSPIKLCNMLLPSKLNMLFSQPIRSKTKPNHDLAHVFSRFWHQLHVFASSFDWFIAICGYVVIGHMWIMWSLWSGAWNRPKFIHCSTLTLCYGLKLNLWWYPISLAWAKGGNMCIARMVLSCSLLTLEIVLIQSHSFSESWRWVRTVKVLCLKARPRIPPTVASCSLLVDRVLTPWGLGARLRESSAVHKVQTCSHITNF